MEAVFAKIAEETTNFGLGDEEVRSRINFSIGDLSPISRLFMRVAGANRFFLLSM